jgi:hypothetical protein
MLIGIIGTGKTLTEDDLRELIYKETTEEEIVDFFNECYAPVDLPFFGSTEVGDIMIKMLSPMDYEFVREDYVEMIYEDLIYSLRTYDDNYFKGYNLVLLEDED